MVENVSTYLQYRDSTMKEGEFLSLLCEKTGCEILLDINNAYVNEINHGVDARGFIRSLPADQVREVHLAGFEDKGEYLIDAHNNLVANPVWELYEYFVQLNGERATLIEWDNDIPEFKVLMEEAQRAEKILSASREVSAESLRVGT